MVSAVLITSINSYRVLKHIKLNKTHKALKTTEKPAISPTFSTWRVIRNGNKIKVEFARDEFAA